MYLVLISLLAMGGLGLLMSLILVVASRKFAIRRDPLEEKIIGVLPGANCGACGYPGCEAYAKALIKKETSPEKCTASGPEVVEKLALLLGVKVEKKVQKVAFLKCAGGSDIVKEKARYEGIENCSAASLLPGTKDCPYGCIGFGDCKNACPFNAITMKENKLPGINRAKCTGCGICVKVCPRELLTLIPKAKMVYLACNSLDKGATVRKACKVGCFACGLCVKTCPAGALTIKNNLIVMDIEKCNDCGECANACPSSSFVNFCS